MSQTNLSPRQLEYHAWLSSDIHAIKSAPLEFKHVLKPIWNIKFSEVTMPTTIIDVVVPTYKEARNIPLLIERIDALRRSRDLRLHLTIVDDNSRDGTEEAIQQMNLAWVSLIVRTTDRGLSSAVLEGLRRTSGDIIVVMDADLSHPPEAIAAMLDELDKGSDFVVGSRYAEGGVTDDNWGMFRWLNSRIATLLARPFTSIKDPMSGFFALRRLTYSKADFLNPIGYKIGLELLVKCRCNRITEVPIAFADRIHGESKLSVQEQLRYLQHIRRLFLYKYGTWSEVIQFIVVGASGVLVNILGVTALPSRRIESKPLASQPQFSFRSAPISS